MLRVNRRLGRQCRKLLNRETAVPSDFGQHSLRRGAGKLAYCRTHYGSKRQDGFMDGDQIDNIAGPLRSAAADALLVARSTGCST